MSSLNGKSSHPPIGHGRDTHSSEQEPKIWEDFIVLGARRQLWIDNPRTPCKIQRSHLTMQNLHDQGWYIRKRASEAVHWLDFGELQALGLTCDAVNLTRNFDLYRYAGETWGVKGADWDGFTGPGVIMISNIMRTPQSPSPPMSEITKAVYERTFDTNSLR